MISYFLVIFDGNDKRDDEIDFYCQFKRSKLNLNVLEVVELPMLLSLSKNYECLFFLCLAFGALGLKTEELVAYCFTVQCDMSK